ncbi:hypothetical protein B9Z55_027114 [Caenorhabditis nigoni]|uniref:Uncharacterized protein n=1 Tax=Caenorhabditis nigoni TaxID=1611254 RepID=A0A2G5SIP0_9PELO|nr:hypothetical protein B9Z55_027114 [Caenorhabditis nigoni]
MKPNIIMKPLGPMLTMETPVQESEEVVLQTFCQELVKSITASEAPTRSETESLTIRDTVKYNELCQTEPQKSSLRLQILL